MPTPAERELKKLEKQARCVYKDYTLQELTDLLYLAEHQLESARSRSSGKLPQCEHNYALIQMAWGMKLPKSE